MPRLPASSSLVALLSLTATASCKPAIEADPRIQAHWENPSRCGQATYAWRDDLALGEVLEWHPGSPLGLFEELTVDALERLMQDSGRDLGVTLGHDVASYRLRYRTQDRGARTDATGILAVPLPASTASDVFPLMIYFHGSAGLNDSCAPSGGLGDYLVSMALASMGYVVVTPDYLGLRSMGAPSEELHAYVLGEPTAITSLDSARAARRLLPELDLGVTLNEQVVYFGGSQGGHASLFAARFAPYYAPDLLPLAVVASVPPADIVAELVRATETRVDATVNTANVLPAWGDWYGLDNSALLMPPLDTDIPLWLHEHCGIGGVPGSATLEEIFTAPFLASASAGFTGDDPWSCAVRENSLPHTSVASLMSIPTLFVLSENDELVHTPAERLAFDTLCEQGMEMEYLECAGATHTEGAVGSVTAQLEFLRARLAGETWPAAVRCDRTPPVACF